MTVTREEVLRHYVAAMREGDAALFIGAGMSRPAGFVDWRGLLRDCARQLNLDIDREHDLVAVAQYHLNRRGRDRGQLNRILRDAFDRPGTPTRNHAILARLPVSTIWTTNFDSLLEDALEAAHRNVDVKSRDLDIAMPKRGREVVLYKMHGDIARPDEVIICKEDYERYATQHPLFQTTLQSDLVSKTFLFLGFSFTDPNLDYMLGHLRVLLEDNKREHYAVMRRARLDWHARSAAARRAYEYEANKQALQIEDLQRYGIQTVLVDQYDEVTEMLEAIERCYHERSVFVSGSANEFGDFGEDRMRDLCMQLGERLVEGGYKLISGVGRSVGDAVVKGALVRLFERGQAGIEKHLFLRPFPRNLPAGVGEAEFNAKYREEMIAKCGFAVFIAGNSRSHPESVGVLQEYEIARRLNKVPIPLGATGFAARRIWQMIEPDVRTVYSGAVPMALFRRLNAARCSNEQLLDAVFEVIERVAREVGRPASAAPRAPLATLADVAVPASVGPAARAARPGSAPGPARGP